MADHKAEQKGADTPRSEARGLKRRMGKHETGYARVERDLYPTPHWVVSALAEHIDLRGLTVWEPACGDGRMAEALRLQGCARVYTSDIVDRGMGQVG